MDKIKIGIPRGMYYYYYGDLWCRFFEELGCEVIVSPKTNRMILEHGTDIANDEMCLSLKVMLGHIAYLKDLCDFILIPRIDNYGIKDQTCTNFLALYDIVNNLFDTKILNYNIDLIHHQNEFQGFYEMGCRLWKTKSQIVYAYQKAVSYQYEKMLLKRKQGTDKLRRYKTKILIVGHPYNIYDDYIGKSITEYLEKAGVIVLYPDEFDLEKASKLSSSYSKTLYWKYSKENIGVIKMIEHKLDGVIFLSTFPCGPDSLVNELVMRRMNLPHLNLVIDDMDALAGIETRLESFLDILNEKRKVK